VSGAFEARRKRLYDIIEVGNDGDFISTVYDMVNVLTILLNLTVSILLIPQEQKLQKTTLTTLLKSQALTT